MSSRRIIGLFVLLEIVIAGIAVTTDGFSISALQTTTRFSGRLSLLLFSGIFLLHHKPDTLHSWLSENSICYLPLFMVSTCWNYVPMSTFPVRRWFRSGWREAFWRMPSYFSCLSSRSTKPREQFLPKRSSLSRPCSYTTSG